MKNNGLLLVLLAAAAYFLTQKKSGAATTTPDFTTGECLGMGEALVYFAGAWLRAGRLPSNMPNLYSLIPGGGSGGFCITRSYLDNLVRESL